MKISKAFTSSIETFENEPRCVVAKITTAALDRDGEVVMPQGCNSKDFEAAPMVFFQHDFYSGMPVGKCIDIKRIDDSIIAKTEFASRPEGHPEGEEWFPDTLLSLYKQGVMKGWSISFDDIESRQANDADRMRYGKGCKRVYSKWKLLEYSAVSMPANQEALTVAVSKGLSLSPELAERLGLKLIPPSKVDPPKPIQRKKTIIILPGQPRKLVSESELIDLAIARSKGLSRIR